MTPPTDIIHDYVNEYIIELDEEDDFAYDISEDDSTRAPTMADYKVDVLRNVVHIKNIVRSYITTETKSVTLELLDTVKKKFLHK